MERPPQTKSETAPEGARGTQMDTIIKTTQVTGRAGFHYLVRSGSMDLGRGPQYFTDVSQVDAKGRLCGMVAVTESEFPTAEAALAGHDALIATYNARGQWRFR